MSIARVFVTVLLVAALVSACGKKDEPEATTTTASATSASDPESLEKKTQNVVLFGGAVVAKVPADLQEAVNHDDVHVFDGGDLAITVGGAAAPDGNAGVLVQQFLDNLKRADGNLTVVSQDPVALGDKQAKGLEVRMQTSGRDIYMAAALAVIDGKMITIQVVGPQGEQANVSATAKAIYESVIFQRASLH